MPPTVTDHFQKSLPGGEILRCFFEMYGKGLDALRQNGDLDSGAPGVFRIELEFVNQRFLFFFGYCHFNTISFFTGEVKRNPLLAQAGLGAELVPLDLLLKLPDAGERAFGPQLLDEFDLHVLAVEVAPETEEIHFQCPRPRAARRFNRRPDADVAHPSVRLS